MKCNTSLYHTFLLGIFLVLSGGVFAREIAVRDSIPETITDSLSVVESSYKFLFRTAPKKSFAERNIHRIGIEMRPGYILPTNPFYAGYNGAWEPIRHSFSTHLKYSFQPKNTNMMVGRIWGKPYQGIGLSYYALDNREELGDPMAVYVFQGAQIAQFNSRFSLNYEWNFGLSAGWNPYDYYENDYNKAIGSKVNAYIHLNVHLNYAVSPEIDLVTGFGFTHFSNGNTKIPNAGLNATGFNLGIVYNLNREERDLNTFPYPGDVPPMVSGTPWLYKPNFTKHISYDLLLFGSWRRKTIENGGDVAISPKAYMVGGFNFAPMYNFCHKWRAGLSLDGVYDGSANTYIAESMSAYYGDGFKSPPVSEQLALGLSVRAEYIMPYFTVGVGVGRNFLYGGGDLKAYYQAINLKTELTRNSYLNVGYSILNFHYPNYLMLGIGYRFNNKRPFWRF